MSAVSGVFFAYIGFDAISVLSEETKNPQKVVALEQLIRKLGERHAYARL
jgi:amino acid transporter